jgi:hypothetical protein
VGAMGRERIAWRAGRELAPGRSGIAPGRSGIAPGRSGHRRLGWGAGVGGRSTEGPLCAESSRSLDAGPSPGLSRCRGLG